MQPQTEISYFVKDRRATESYRTGVSLHSHTSASEESLTFIHQMSTGLPLMTALFRYYERSAMRHHKVQLNFLSAHWRPPLLPRMAFDVEYRQIAALKLEPLISITDHDNIEAPMLLRTLKDARTIPVSVEWTTQYGMTEFHLGIHNIPSAEAKRWMLRFEWFTAAPNDEKLHELLGELHAIPQVLIVLNHPLWDLYKVGQKRHEAELERFLHENGGAIHALELNGLRHARENRDVARLAGRWDQLLISGGDRHGIEANANINLTNAISFTEFVREIREERRSHVLFMPQYDRPWEERIAGSTMDAITDHAHFSPGWQRWDERAFHQDAEGVMRPLAELWPNGRAPLTVRLAIQAARLFRFRTLAMTLRMAFPGVNSATVEGVQVRDLA